MANKKYDYLLVGNSTAAVGTIEAIRTCDKKGTIGVVAHESEHTYSRPLITYFMAGKVEEENVYYRPMDFYRRNEVDCMLGVEMSSIDTKKKTVKLSDDSEVGYENILLAAGGAPFAPPIPGIDRPGVFFMNTMDDARAAKGWLSHSNRAIVVGAGLTGLKTAEALVQLGKEVTVVEMMDDVLAMALDKPASQIVKDIFIEKGVDVLTGVQTTSIEGGEDVNDVTGVAINTGEVIACETVFVTVGVRPRTQIVEGSDIEVGRGILVDRKMQTNVPGVYAAGDIAEAYDPLSGGNRVLPILPNAYIGGRVAGLNMCGKEATYNVGMSVNSVAFFGFPTMSAGFATQAEDDEFKVLSKLDGRDYRKLVVKDDKIVGMILSGSVERAGVITGMMRGEVPITGIEDKLMSGDLGLIDLPDEVVKERIATSGRNWQ